MFATSESCSAPLEGLVDIPSVHVDMLLQWRMFFSEPITMEANMAEQKEKDQPEKGQMTVEEAGRKGGHIGGEHTRDKYGPEFYSEIGHKGGQRVRELVEEGKQAEEEGSSKK